MVVSILANEAGNLALKVLATGGVHLAGGVALHLLAALKELRFMQVFTRKGFEDRMRRIQVHVITARAALVGAATFGLESLRGHKEQCMSESFPSVYLARHGETAWTVTGQHTGRADLPLTERGECNARQLRERLSGLTFAKVFTSPLQRAMRTCKLAGFGSVAHIDRDLVEWNYGEYEGRLTLDILAERPGWELFCDGCPGGESPQQVAIRADRVVERVRAVAGNVLLFSSGHFLRMLAARWTGLETLHARSLMLGTASLSALGYEHSLSQPGIRLWNDTHHVLNANEKDGACEPQKSATSEVTR